MPIEGPALDAPVDITALLGAGLASRPDAPAIASLDEALSWRQLDEMSEALAKSYLAIGLQRGDRIASLMPNRVSLVVHYLACFKAGLVATPLNYRYTALEVDHALDVSGAAALVAHVERAPDIAASRLAPGLRLGTISFGADSVDDRSLERLAADARNDVRLEPVDPAAPAAIFFTSGSTGPAKGVTHTFETLGWMLATAVTGFELTPDDVFLPASSLSHIGAFLWTFASLTIGARVAVAQTVDAHEVFQLLEIQRPTVLAMLPAALTALVRDHDVSPDDFSSLRLCRAGADKVSLELEKEFSQLVGLPIDEGYGMTEVGLASLNPPSGLIKEGSVGRPVAGFRFSIREDGAEVPEGVVGRVWLRSPGQTVGYWNNPEATAEVIDDGWLDSGDLMQADEDGYLWFYGRKKQIIVHDGSNISPLEVEDAIIGHAAVDLVGVVGIHDEVHGENVRAYVTIKPGADRPTAHELIELARARVGYKAPEEIVFLDQMPLNPTGKIDRVGLKQLAEAHLNPHL